MEPCNFRIVNGWSKAGIGTCIVVEHHGGNNNKNDNHRNIGGPRIALDLGSTPAFADAISASCILLSHGHVDHIGGIFSHARAHAMMQSGSVPTYYVPQEIVPLVEKTRDAMMALDAAVGALSSSCEGRKILDMNIVGVTEGTEIILPLGRKLPKGTQIFLRTFTTSHAGCPSTGYVVGTRRKQLVIKPEYKGLSSTELRSLAQRKIPFKDEIVEEKLDIAYTGDTTIAALVDHADVWSQCHTLFCEVTFLDDKTQDLAEDRGHMHVNDLVRLLNEFKNNASIVIMHISDRYTAPYALNVLYQVLPTHSHRKVYVAAASLRQFHQYRGLATSGIIPLDAYRQDRRKNKSTTASSGTSIETSMSPKKSSK